MPLIDINRDDDDIVRLLREQGAQRRALAERMQEDDRERQLRQMRGSVWGGRLFTEVEADHLVALRWRWLTEGNR